MQKEIWKDIKGYEGLYRISNLGRVKSLKRKRKLNDKILKLCNVNGYLRADLFKNNIKNHYRVARLVAIAFIKNEFNKPQVNHKDGNKKNNWYKNLEWCTAKENSDHGFRIGINKACGENHYSVKLTSKQVKKIRGLYPKYKQYEIAEMFNCTPQNISCIINLKTRKREDV